MEMDYIVFWKRNKRIPSNLKSSFMGVLYNEFKVVNDPYIVFEVKDKRERVLYEIQKDVTDKLFFKVTHNGSDMASAKILDCFSKKLLNCRQRADYNIIVSYDGAANLFCCKAMPLFAEFERRLRELVYATVVRAFGEEWVKKSFDVPREGTRKLYKNNIENEVESALNEFDLANMEIYLFAPYCLVDPDKVIAEILEDNSISHKQIISKLHSAKKLSLWERLFYEYKELADLKDRLRELRPIRNQVMHCKPFTFEELERTRKELRFVNKRLKTAIEVFENGTYDRTTIQSMASSFALLSNAFQRFDFKGLSIGISEQMAEIAKSIGPSRELLDAYSKNMAASLEPLRTEVARLSAQMVLPSLGEVFKNNSQLFDLGSDRFGRIQGIIPSEDEDEEDRNGKE